MHGPDVDEAGRRLDRVSVHTLVSREEVGMEAFEPVIGARVERYLQEIALADVVEVGEVQDLNLAGGEPLPLRQLPAGRVELGDDAPHRGHGEPGKGLAIRDGYLVLDRRSEQSGGREHAGMVRHDHPRDAEIVCVSVRRRTGPVQFRSFAPSPRMNGEVPRRFAGRSLAKQRISGYGHGTLT